MDATDTTTAISLIHHGTRSTPGPTIRVAPGSSGRPAGQAVTGLPDGSRAAQNAAVVAPEVATRSAVTSCPRCDVALISEVGAVPWCERCEWGLERYEPPVGAGWSARWLGRLSYRVAYRATVAQ